MSMKEGIIAKLEKHTRIGAEIATYLIENTHCLDGDPQKDRAYQVAIQYFTDKQEDSKSTGRESYNWAEATRLGVLIDCYMDGDEEVKIQYAKKITKYILETASHWLKLIPDETKEVAFRIVMQYLEQQRRS